MGVLQNEETQHTGINVKHGGTEAGESSTAPLFHANARVPRGIMRVLQIDETSPRLIFQDLMSVFLIFLLFR